MNHIFDGLAGPINPRDFYSLFSAIAEAPIGNEALFEFFRSNFDKILRDLPDGESVAIDIFFCLTDAATDENVIAKVSFQHHPYTKKII